MRVVSLVTGVPRSVIEDDSTGGAGDTSKRMAYYGHDIII